MKNILKMIKSDFVVVEKLSFPYVVAFLIISFVFSFFGIPLLAIFDFAVMLCIFAPMEIINNDSETKKLYGILPIEKSAVTRASFFEIMLTMFAGEVITIISVFISKVTTLYEILPEKLAETARNFFNPQKNDLALNFERLMFFVIIAFAYMFIVLVYLKMINETSSQSIAIVHLSVIVLVTIIAVIILGRLSYHSQIPNIKKFIPTSASTRIILYIALNIFAVVVGMVCCEHTVKKLAAKEI